jgi:hypothetical protein
MTKPAKKIILQRMDDEAFRHPIADSAKGIYNFDKQTDEKESTWGRLNKLAREAACSG